MLRVYGMTESGNCYKVKLLLRLLGREHEWIETDSRSGVTRSAPFLAKNPNGRVPLLEIAPGDYLPESNAILYYLGRDTPYFPESLREQAEVLQWMFFEQYSHEPYIATLRSWIHLMGAAEQYQAEIEARRPRGYAALAVMETHLAAGRSYFAGERYSIADIALYAYTHVAHEGGFNLDDYPAVRAWLARVGAAPGHIGMFD